MHFEGLELVDAADIMRHIRARTVTRPRDARPWSWVIRFCQQGDDARALVDEALGRLIREEAGAELRPDDFLREMCNLASLCHARSHVPLLLEYLVRPLTDWSDEDVNTLLGWLLGARPESLGQEQLDALVRHSVRPSCFLPVFMILARISPARASELVARHMVDAWQVSDDRAFLVQAVASRWRMANMAPYRMEMLHALADAPDALQQPFRRWLERQASSAGRGDLVGREIDISWSARRSEIEGVEPFAMDIATTAAQAYLSQDLASVRGLLADPARDPLLYRPDALAGGARILEAGPPGLIREPSGDRRVFEVPLVVADETGVSCTTRLVVEQRGARLYLSTEAL